MFNLLRFRNHSEAFNLDGTITVETPSENRIIIRRTDRTGENEARLEADFRIKEFKIYENNIKINI